MDTNENSSSNGFVAWEYTDIYVDRNLATMYTDCYQNFGWTLIDQNERNYISDIGAPQFVPISNIAGAVQSGGERVNLKFKRNSRLPNKIQLNKLQQECEDALTSIDRLENRKMATTTGPLLGFGILGGGATALSVYAFTIASIPLCVLFAAVGFVGFLAAYMSFAKGSAKKTAKINPEIQGQFDTVYRTCEQANALLA